MPDKMRYADMDVLPYIRSRAIREHLAAIGHRFTPLEAAVLIQLSDRSLTGRIEAWRELLRRSEDVELPPRVGFPPGMSLHTWLREDIRRSEYALRLFEAEEPGAVWRPELGESCFSLEDCMDEAARLGDVILHKTWIEAQRVKDHIMAIYSPGCGYEHIEITGCGLPEPPSAMGLYAFWIHVPTPFRRGDLLRDREGELLILTEDERRHMTERRRQELEATGTFMDMCVKGVPLGAGAEDGEPGTPVGERDWLYLELDWPEYEKR